MAWHHGTGSSPPTLSSRPKTGASILRRVLQANTLALQQSKLPKCTGGLGPILSFCYSDYAVFLKLAPPCGRCSETLHVVFTTGLKHHSKYGPPRSLKRGCCRVSCRALSWDVLVNLLNMRQLPELPARQALRAFGCCSVITHAAPHCDVLG